MFVLPRGDVCYCPQIKTRLEVAADEKGTQVLSAIAARHNPGTALHDAGTAHHQVSSAPWPRRRELVAGI